MKTVIYTSLDKELLAEWLQLWKNSPFANNINGPQWFLSVIESFNYKNYRIIGVYDGKKLLAVAGFVEEKRFGIKLYTLAPNDFVCGLPFLVDLNDTQLLKTLISVFSQLHTVFLSNIPETSLHIFTKDTLVITSTPQTVNRFLDLQRDDKQSVLIPHRKKLLRAIRGIEEKFTMRRFDGSTDEGLDIAFSLDEQSRKHVRGYNTFSDPQIKKFYLSLAHYFRKQFCVHILYYEDNPIAYEMGFLIEKTYFGTQIAFATSYESYSPGKVLLVKVLDSLSERNVERMDFGSGDGLIKRLLADQSQNLYQIILCKRPLVGKYILSMNSLKNFFYENLHQHVKVYRAYRLIIKKLL